MEYPRRIDCDVCGKQMEDSPDYCWDDFKNDYPKLFKIIEEKLPGSSLVFDSKYSPDLCSVECWLKKVEEELGAGE
jgi:hypothetical protein